MVASPREKIYIRIKNKKYENKKNAKTKKKN